jgi:hypothetical protein
MNLNETINDGNKWHKVSGGEWRKGERDMILAAKKMPFRARLST